MKIVAINTVVRDDFVPRFTRRKELKKDMLVHREVLCAQTHNL